MRTSILMAAIAIAVATTTADIAPVSAAGLKSHPEQPTYHSRGDVRRHDGAWSYDTWRGLRQRERVRAYARVVPPGYYRPRAYLGRQRYLPPKPLSPYWERPHIPGELGPSPFFDHR